MEPIIGYGHNIDEYLRERSEIPRIGRASDFNLEIHCKIVRGRQQMSEQGLKAVIYPEIDELGLQDFIRKIQERLSNTFVSMGVNTPQ